MALKKRRRPRRGHYQRGEYVSTKSGETYRYRSGWERSYMEHLDRDPDVRSWIYEGIAIEYVSNKRTGKTRRYFPDFVVTHVDGTRRVVEVKPSRKVSKANNVKKAKAAETWCAVNGCSYVILTEHDLVSMGLL